jgi:hypothetical protein
LVVLPVGYESPPVDVERVDRPVDSEVDDATGDRRRHGDGLESVRGFARDEVDSAVFCPGDDHFLVDRETVVCHYAVH